MRYRGAQIERYAAHIVISSHKCFTNLLHLIQRLQCFNRGFLDAFWMLFDELVVIVHILRLLKELSGADKSVSISSETLPSGAK